MTCPKCGSEQTGCIDSRNGKRKRRRRYVCRDCGGRFSTYELYADEVKDSADALQRLLEASRGWRDKTPERRKKRRKEIPHPPDGGSPL